MTLPPTAKEEELQPEVAATDLLRGFQRERDTYRAKV